MQCLYYSAHSVFHHKLKYTSVSFGMRWRSLVAALSSLVCFCWRVSGRSCVHICLGKLGCLSTRCVMSVSSTCKVRYFSFCHAPVALRQSAHHLPHEDDCSSVMCISCFQILKPPVNGSLNGLQVFPDVLPPSKIGSLPFNHFYLF